MLCSFGKIRQLCILSSHKLVSRARPYVVHVHINRFEMPLLKSDFKSYSFRFICLSPSGSVSALSDTFRCLSAVWVNIKIALPGTAGLMRQTDRQDDQLVR